MALIDSLKNFYRDNVEDVNKLNDADSVLEVLRAKYGDYRGANIEEYFKELVANDVKPSSGGGGGDFSTAKVTFSVSSGDLNAFMPFDDGGYICNLAYMTDDDTNIFDVILYGEGTLIYLDRQAKSIEGDVEDAGNAFIGSQPNTFKVYIYLVKGDCTITVKNESPLPPVIS